MPCFWSLLVFNSFDFNKAAGAVCEQFDKISLQLQWLTQPQFAGYQLPNSADPNVPKYLDECLNVQVRGGGPDFDPLEELITNKADVALTDGMYVATRNSNGDNFTIIANYFQRSAIVLVGLQRIGSIQDLAGKRIGVWCCGNDQPIRLMLARANVSVTFVEQDFSMQQLYSGDVFMASAMIYNELARVLQQLDPKTRFLRQQEDVAILSPTDFGAPHLHSVLVVRTDKLQQLRSKLVRMLRVVTKTWIFCRDNERTCVGAFPDGSSVHFMWQMREINRLIFPSGNGIGVLSLTQWRALDSYLKESGITSDLLGDDPVDNSLVFEAGALEYPQAPYSKEAVKFCAPYDTLSYALCHGNEHTLCPMGQEPRGAQDFDCSVCPPGRYAYNKLSPEAARMNTCIPCSAGRYQNFSGATACIACPVDHISSAGAPFCTRCDLGLVALGVESTICIAGVGFYKNLVSGEAVACGDGMTTYLPGATSRDACICQEGYTRHCGLFQGDAKYCQVDTRHRPCVKCPVGIRCRIHPNIYESMQAMPGFMVMPDDPFSVYTCIKGDRFCSQFRNVHEGTSMCPLNFEVSPRCAECQARFYLTGDGCIPCEVNSPRMLALKLIGLYVIQVFVLTYMYLRFNRVASPEVTTLSNLIVFTQMLSLLLDLDLKLKDQKPLDRVAALLNIMFSMTRMTEVIFNINLRCFESMNFWSKVLLEVISPLVGILIFFTIGLGALVVRRPLKRDYVLNIIGKIFSGLYVSIAAMALTIFAGEWMPGGKRFMVKAHPAVELGTEEWWHAVPIALVAFLVYCLGFFALITHAVLKAPQAVSHDKNFVIRFRFAFGAFRPDCWWWILVQLLYVLVANMITIFSTGVVTQIIGLFIITIFVLVAFYYVRPLKHLLNNYLQIGCIVTLLVLMFSSSYYVDWSVTTEQHLASVRETLALFCFVLISAVFMGAFIHIVYCVWRWRYPLAWRLGDDIAILHDFRAMAILLLMMPNRELHLRVSKLGEVDLFLLGKVIWLMKAVMFGEVPSHRLWHQRLMPGVPLLYQTRRETFMKVFAAFHSGDLQVAIQKHFEEIQRLGRLVTALHDTPHHLSTTMSIDSTPLNKAAFEKKLSSMLPENIDDAATMTEGLFEMMDVDGSGYVSMTEFESAIVGILKNTVGVGGPGCACCPWHPQRRRHSLSHLRSNSIYKVQSDDSRSDGNIRKDGTQQADNNADAVESRAQGFNVFSL